jgi:hypothetical protein
MTELQIPSRECINCGRTFFKPASCSMREWEQRRRNCSPECGNASRSKKPSRASFIPCRICGGATRFHGTERNGLHGMLHCENPECAEASRAIKNARISAKATEMYRTGERKLIRHTWESVPRVSREEDLLRPWFESMGWRPQYHVLTHVHTNKLPRAFDLDFAFPENMLYIEIDGKVHRLRKERDERRDLMLRELGWRGKRIPANLVREDIDAAKASILDFVRRFD